MFCKHREAIELPRIDTLGCQQKEIDTKEDEGKCKMCALYVLQYAERHLLTETSEKLKEGWLWAHTWFT